MMLRLEVKYRGYYLFLHWEIEALRLSRQGLSGLSVPGLLITSGGYSEKIRSCSM